MRCLNAALIASRYIGGMPFKSKAQRRKFAELLVNGDISPETYEEWNRETGGKVLPERVKKKRTKKAKSARKRKSTSKRKVATKRVAKRKTAAKKK